MAAHGTFYWNELVSPDQRVSGDFYCALLGLSKREVDSGPFGTYTLFMRKGKDVAAMMNPTSDYSRGKPSWWSAYIAVDDIDACAARAIDLGGRLVEPVTDIPGVGRACMIADPLGAVICLMTPVETSATSGAPNAPASGMFMWNHLVTPDQRRSGEFYCGLLGWQRREVDAGPFGVYTVFQINGTDVAGMMNPTIEFTRARPSQWYAYVAVDNIDTCAARTEPLGGKVVAAPHQVPGMGRACLITDPQGAPLTLVQEAT